MKKADFIEGGIQKIQGIMISKNAPCWEKFRFISGAKSKDQTRFFMSGIHIEREGDKTLLISTDGRRLHIATLDTLDIEPGEYEVKENTRDFMILYPAELGQYPNWRQITKKIDSQKHIVLNISSKNKLSFSQTLYDLYKSTNEVFNMEYLEPLAAVNGSRYDNNWKVYFNINSNKAAVFINKDLMAVIMPAQHKDVTIEDINYQSEYRDVTPQLVITDKRRSTKTKPQKIKAV